MRLQITDCFRAILALLATGALLAGCTDDSSGAPWDVNESTDTQTTQSDTSSTPDTTADTGTPEDSSNPPDTTTPADTTDPPDGELITREGMRLVAFESDAFYPHSNAMASYEDNCRFRSAADEAADQRWWVNESPTVALDTADGPMALAVVRATGYLSEEGEYGHMGAYNHEFDITESEILPCESMERFGNCVVPRIGDQCYSGVIRHSDMEPEPTLTEIDDDGTGYQTFELDVAFNQNVADGGVDVLATFAVPVPRDTGGFGIIDAAQLDNLEITKECAGFGGLDYMTYGADDITGWVQRIEGGGLRVALRAIGGTEQRPDLNYCQDNELRLWGHFERSRRNPL